MASTRTRKPTTPVVEPSPVVAVTAPDPILSGVTATTVVGDHAFGMSLATVTVDTLATLATASADSDVTIAVGVALLTTGDSPVTTVDALAVTAEDWPGKPLKRSALFQYRNAGSWLLLTGTSDYAVGRAALSLAANFSPVAKDAVKAWRESVPAMSSEEEARAALASILVRLDRESRDARAAARAAAPKAGDTVTGTVVGKKGTTGPKATPADAPKTDSARLHAVLPILAAVKADGKPSDDMVADAEGILAHAVRIALALGIDVAGTVATLTAE